MVSLEEFIENSRDFIRKLMDTHFRSVEHDEKRKEIEIRLISENFNFIRKKWVVEILWELEINGGMIFNEFMRRLKNISSRLLSDRLKDLKRYRLISRMVRDTSPPSVLYDLTDKGKGFIEFAMLLIFFMSGIKDKDLM